MAKLTILNGEKVRVFVPQPEYTIAMDRHYAFTGGGPMTPSYYGIDGLIDFPTILGTNTGYIAIDSYTRESPDERPVNGITHRIVQDIKTESGVTITTDQVVPIQKLDIHYDWQDRVDRLRTIPLFIKYSSDNISFTRIRININVSEELVSNPHN